MKIGISIYIYISIYMINDEDVQHGIPQDYGADLRSFLEILARHFTEVMAGCSELTTQRHGKWWKIRGNSWEIMENDGKLMEKIMENRT